jgi:N-acetyl-gamma-glutamyl-phosphate reductase
MADKIKAAILGATGYTALELIQLLLRHPRVEILQLTSRQDDRPHISAIHPRLTGKLDLRISPADPRSLSHECDIVFSCLPHAASAEVLKSILSQGNIKAIDLSADYRLNDVDTYARWYGIDHPDPARVGKVPYGLGEFFADDIASARLVANPGCYPTSAIMALGPLLKLGLISPDDIIIDSKSAVSGSGRTPKLTNLFSECNESFAPYGVGHHRHLPEIELILSRIAGQALSVIFTPHLVPMDRGILTTSYARPNGGQSEKDFFHALREFYAPHPFVRVIEHLPSTKYVAGTNFCDLAVRVVKGRVIVMSAIDNLIKGASGAAVQNMNLMFGLPLTDGLL